MNTATIILVMLLVGTACLIAVGDLWRRTGRGTPPTRMRTGLTRRPGRGAPDDPRGVLAAGQAAQVLGPLLARAAAAVRRAEAADVELRRERRTEREAFEKRATYVSRFTGEGVLAPSHARWHRYALYFVVLGTDVAVGVVAAHMINIGDPEALGFGASSGLLLFFAGKLVGAGLRRLDLDGGPDLAADCGRVWVSKLMIIIGLAGLAVFLIGFAAARLVGLQISDAAIAASASSAPGSVTTAAPLPPTASVAAPATVVTSLLAVGGWMVTLVIALRSHPHTGRLEELDHRLHRARRRSRRAVRAMGRAMAASAAAIALAEAGLAEATARLHGPDAGSNPPVMEGLRTALTQIETAHETLANRWHTEDASAFPGGEGTSLTVPVPRAVPSGNGRAS